MSDMTSKYVNRIVREYPPIQIRVDSDEQICVAIYGFNFPDAEGGSSECVGYGSTLEDALNDAAVDVDD